MLQGKNASGGASNDQEVRVRGSEVFVGGLSRSTTESMIHEIFSHCGEILGIRMMKDQNGTSKGFCFVRFATKEAAFKAQKEKNGVMLHGKKIGVALSSDQDSLFFGNLRKDWSSEEFDRLVRQVFQDVASVDLAMPSSTGDFPTDKKQLNRGFAFVQFSSHAVFNNLMISLLVNLNPCIYTPLFSLTFYSRRIGSIPSENSLNLVPFKALTYLSNSIIGQSFLISVQLMSIEDERNISTLLNITV